VKTKKLLSALAVASALACGAGVSSAQPVFYAPITNFEDDNLDFVFDTNSNGTIDVGDRLLAVVKWNQTFGNLPGQGPSNIAPHELTGVADVTITAMLAPNVFRLGATNTTGPGGAGALSAFAANTAVALWLDATPDTDVINANCGTRAACIASASDTPPPWATFGFFADPDASWVANTLGNSITTVENGNASLTFGTFNFALDLGINNTGVVLGDQACAPFCSGAGNGQIELVGQGSVLGGTGLDHTQWTARSDADFSLAVVPEPGTLALLGGALAVAGFGALRRRKAV
jgi:hypothetical protein